MFLLISEGQSSGPSSVDEGALGDSLRPSSLGAGVSSSSSSSGASCLSSSSSSCSPSGSSAEWQYLLIETSSQSSDGSSEGRLAGVLSSLLEKGMADDGVWPEGAAQQQNIWNIRESIAPAMAHQGVVFKFDVSLPPARIYELVEATRGRLRSLGLEGQALAVGYGHVGDGNVHLNVRPLEGAAANAVKEAIDPWVYERVASWGGSISAEHGMGLVKAGKMHLAKDKDFVQLMQQVKDVFDPKHILNPYKVWDPPVHDQHT
eukprot:GHVT01033911.1.p2 GENE.GHVT01033911.1~~GHVT01033911.1.p2  ORF type:complete len:261 (-),score=77.06 GHVT01033911.1:3294-4076(-)